MMNQSLDRRYELRSKWLDAGMSIASVPVLIAVSSFIIARTTEADGRQHVIWFAGALLVLSLLGVYKALRVPTAIATRGDGTITFESFIGTETISVFELQSVKHMTLQPEYLIFTHARGKVRTRHRFNDFYQFLSWVRQVNPRVEIVGC